MDYREMAAKLLEYMHPLQRGPARRMNEVNQGEMAMLGYLTFEKSEVSPTELSKLFNLSTARVANTLNSLEKKGYIQRIHDSKDRRKVIVRLTKLGADVSEQRHQEAIGDVAELLRNLGEEDAKEYVRLMEKIYKLIQGKERKRFV